MTDPSKATLGAAVPNLHFILIVVAAVTLLVSLLGFYFAPAEKAEFFKYVVGGTLVFLFGKFSNSFGKSLRVLDPTVQAVPDDDDTLTQDS